ncbi:MAG: hypothetical protein WCJ64_02015 [Rhodospirillaceae bacterium]
MSDHDDLDKRMVVCTICHHMEVIDDAEYRDAKKHKCTECLAVGRFVTVFYYCPECDGPMEMKHDDPSMLICESCKYEKAEKTYTMAMFSQDALPRFRDIAGSVKELMHWAKNGWLYSINPELLKHAVALQHEITILTYAIQDSPQCLSMTAQEQAYLFLFQDYEYSDYPPTTQLPPGNSEVVLLTNDRRTVMEDIREQIQ